MWTDWAYFKYNTHSWRILHYGACRQIRDLLIKPEKEGKGYIYIHYNYYEYFFLFFDWKFSVTFVYFAPVLCVIGMLICLEDTAGVQRVIWLLKDISDGRKCASTYILCVFSRKRRTTSSTLNLFLFEAIWHAITIYYVSYKLINGPHYDLISLKFLFILLKAISVHCGSWRLHLW